jgi:hypothetical protein
VLFLNHYLHNRKLKDYFGFATFLGGGIGSWTQDLMLARQVLFHLIHSTTLFVLGIFKKESGFEP